MRSPGNEAAAPGGQSVDTTEPVLDVGDFWDMSIDMLAVVSLDGYFIRVSPSWETVLGYSPSEMTARSFIEFVHPEDVERTRAEGAALLDVGHRTVNFENRYRARDGSYRWLAWSARTNGDATSVYCIVRDVTEAREAHRDFERAHTDLLQRDLMLTGVLDNTMTLIYVKDLDGRYLLYNDAFCEAFGLRARAAEEGIDQREVLLGRDDHWLDPELQPVWRENDLRAAAASYFVEEWSSHPERGTITWDSIKFPLFDASGKLYATCGVSTETTERTQAVAHYKEAEARFRGAFEYAPIGMALVNLDYVLTSANVAMSQITGYDAATLMGMSVRNLLDRDHERGVVEAIEELFQASAASTQRELKFANASGHTIWVSASTSILSNDEGDPTHFILQVADISDRKRLEERLRRVADHDPLTGIRNRRLFEEDLQQQISRCQRYGETASLLMIDLDDFKQINDNHGHKVGDDVLKAVAGAVSKRLRSGDQVARLGGDEFAVLLPYVGRRNGEAVAADLASVIAGVCIKAGEQIVTPVPSVGVAFLDEETPSAEAAMVEADRAMYRAKARTKSRLAASTSEPPTTEAPEHRLV